MTLQCPACGSELEELRPPDDETIARMGIAVETRTYFCKECNELYSKGWLKDRIFQK